jgi:putative transposase
VELILERAKENFSGIKPRVISDNGPQFIARYFKEFIRISGMTHVKISPFYPQSNGKLERWHQSLKREYIRPGIPLTGEDARRLVAGHAKYYNEVRLHSALGYVSPKEKLEGREKEIFAARDAKLEAARQLRQQRRRKPGGTGMARLAIMGQLGYTESGCLPGLGGYLLGR